MAGQQCKECFPYQAFNGFVIGAQSNSINNTLMNYTSWADWIPTATTADIVNYFGTMWKKVGDQIYLNINVIFVSQTNTASILIGGLPEPIMLSTAVFSNGAIIEDGFATPSVLVNAQLSSDVDPNTLLLTAASNFVIGDTYTLNAQFVYKSSIL